MNKFLFWLVEVLAEKIGDYKEKKRLAKIKPVAQSKIYPNGNGFEYLLLEVEDENERIPEA